MRQYIHPLSEEKVVINKALLATVIAFLEGQNRPELVYQLEETLEDQEYDDLINKLSDYETT